MADTMTEAMIRYPWLFQGLVAVIALIGTTRFTARTVSSGTAVLWSAVTNVTGTTVESVSSLWEKVWNGPDPALTVEENARLEAIARRVSDLRKRWYTHGGNNVSPAMTAELINVGDEVVHEILGQNLASQPLEIPDPLLNIQSVQDFTVAGFVPGYVDSLTTRRIVALLCNQYVTARARLVTRATPAGIAQKAACDVLWLDAFGQPPLPTIDFDGFASQVLPWLDVVEKRFREINVPPLTSPQPSFGNQWTARRESLPLDLVTRRRLASERAAQIQSARRAAVAQYEYDRLHSPSAYDLFSRRFHRQLGMTQEQRLLEGLLKIPGGQALPR